ncbi:hypothetical protein QYE76_013295 [Lolium multiflorum]|uniref:Uncharacterized protein n=1 Tax=Lolium multiflorum TaxID=4521 RepID=A0AAD8U2Q1_LOLMU|nr:hypothetical protein QYE76_013295 [Lolium multiflorum]
MLGIGFEPQTRKIVDEIPRSRQTLMYTATWPKEVTKISGDLSRDPIQINIGNIDELAANNPSHSMQRWFHQWINNAVWSRFLELKRGVQRSSYFAQQRKCATSLPVALSLSWCCKHSW